MSYQAPIWVPRYQAPFDNPTFTSYFGVRPGVGAGFHPGADLQTAGAPQYPQPLSAATSGTVAGVVTTGDGIQGILVVGDDGRSVLYSGLSIQPDGNVLNSNLQVGEPVAAGEQFAWTGDSDGGKWHTHIEVLNGQGTAALGLSQDNDGNWLYKGQPLSSDNQVDRSAY